jgi:hypothetical protein
MFSIRLLLENFVRDMEAVAKRRIPCINFSPTIRFPVQARPVPDNLPRNGRFRESPIDEGGRSEIANHMPTILVIFISFPAELLLVRLTSIILLARFQESRPYSLGRGKP